MLRIIELIHNQLHPQTVRSQDLRPAFADLLSELQTLEDLDICAVSSQLNDRLLGLSSLANNHASAAILTITVHGVYSSYLGAGEHSLYGLGNFHLIRGLHDLEGVLFALPSTERSSACGPSVP